tara:strand:- start:22 stop:279 length:258 start_codon:yes stop_codon:yes gene_type:complete
MVTKTDTWVAEGWIHPKAGGDDYEFTSKWKTKKTSGTNSDDVAELLIRRMKRKLKVKSDVINDFIIYKTGGKKVYPASKDGSFEN